MEDFYYKGYRIGWNHSGNREDEKRVIVITDLGERINLFTGVGRFETLLSWKDGDLRLHLKIETPGSLELGSRGHLNVLANRGKDLGKGIREFIQTIEQTKYAPTI